MFIVEKKQTNFAPFSLHVTTKEDYETLLEVLSCGAFEIGRGADEYAENLLVKAEKLINIVEESQK